MRASVMGSLTGHAWVYLLGMRAGKPLSGANPVVEAAVYTVDSSGNVQTLKGTSGTITLTAVMEDNSGGADYTKKPSAPIILTANVSHALAIRANAGGNYFTHGQDNSGWVMHQRFGIGSAFPSPFAATQVDNQGKISVWAEYQPNRRPKAPSNLTPAPGSTLASTLPAMAADFRDDDETLPGFALGTADKVSAFQFQVLNSAKTTVLKNSTKTTANGTMQTNRRVTWTPTGTPLTPGTYVARCTVWDLTDSPSDTAEWTFVINSGGAFTTFDLSAGTAAGASGGNTITNDASPDVTATWTHADGTSTATVNARIVDASGAVVRGPYTYTVTIANNGSYTFPYATTGWADLPTAQPLRWQLQGIDANGGTSGWASTPAFVVNAAPTVTSLVSPAAGVSVTSRPTLVVDLNDANDADSTLTCQVYVRTGGAGSGTQVAQTSFNAATGYWEAYPTATEMPSLGNYEWSAKATDPWGKVSTQTGWRAVSYVAAPVVTLTNPTNGGTVTVATPTVTWTVDRTMSSYRIVLTKVVSGVTVTEWDSTTITGSVGNQPIPPGKLRNSTTYTMTLTVNTSDGLSVTNVSTFNVAYTQPAVVAGYTVAKFAGTYEGTNQADWSLVKVSWTAPSTGTVSDADWGGYRVRRTNDATGQVDLEAQLYTRPETTFVDYTARSGTSYTYSVVYLKLVNGIDYVESVAATGSITVVLNHTVLTTVDSDQITIPLWYWNERKRTPRFATDVIETWGAKPQVFQGVMDYDKIAGQFRIFDADDGSFSAQDVVAALEAAGRVRYLSDGTAQPRTVCYRDPKRRVMYMAVLSAEEADQREVQEGTVVSLELVEGATDEWGVPL